MYCTLPIITMSGENFNKKKKKKKTDHLNSQSINKKLL